VTRGTWEVLVGDCRERLRDLPDGSVHTVVTSPPYFGLRDYGTGEWEGGDPECDHTAGPMVSAASGLRGGQLYDGEKRLENAMPQRATCSRCGARRVDRQIGLEPTPDEFVQALVQVFREVRRVLRDDGTVWLNLGDSYATTSTYSAPRSMHTEAGWKQDGRRPSNYGLADAKPKDLVGIPWMVAFALRADGWHLRSDIIWAKPNPMPESVTDRPTKAHEYLFLLSKSARYFYDAEAIREDAQDWGTRERAGALYDGSAYPDPTNGPTGLRDMDFAASGRNKRSVWTVATQPYAGAHFATFPPKLIEPCVLAGCPERCCSECGAPWERVVERTPMVVRSSDRAAEQGDEVNDRRTATSGTMIEPPSSRTVGFQPSCACNADTTPGVVLDPFTGAGTTGLVALQHNRSFVGVELNPEYADMARNRIDEAVRLGFRPPVRDTGPGDDHPSLFDLNGHS
jgi:DNA modification methylase